MGPKGIEAERLTLHVSSRKRGTKAELLGREVQKRVRMAVHGGERKWGVGIWISSPAGPQGSCSLQSSSSRVLNSGGSLPDDALVAGFQKHILPVEHAEGQPWASIPGRLPIAPTCQKTRSRAGSRFLSQICPVTCKSGGHCGNPEQQFAPPPTKKKKFHRDKAASSLQTATQR